MTRKAIIPALPKLLERKIYKTGQTRGADDDDIYQNRVSRTSTVLIPYSCWDMCVTPQNGEMQYQNGFVVLISPSEYFEIQNVDQVLRERGLAIGSNALVFYETREQWNANNPEDLHWIPATNRINPLGGQYVARIPATTAERGDKIIRGFSATRRKGVGIRVYEYASTSTIKQCRLQLETFFWLCSDSEAVVQAYGMRTEEATLRRNAKLHECTENGLLDNDRLVNARILSSEGNTICPLCLEELSGQEFFSRMEQAEGRMVLDLTVTRVNLFHITELRVGVLNHRPYNVGWGHHHCNVVVKDSGINQTLEWMRTVLNRNIERGYLPMGNRVL